MHGIGHSDPNCPIFEAALDKFLDELSSDPNLSTSGLYARFPSRAAELDRVLDIARHEVSLEDSEMLPPLVELHASRPQPPGRSQPHSAEGASETLELPTRLGPYELLELIGDGGMGRVFRGVRHKPIKREVAVKIIRHELVGWATVARFRHEQLSLAKMNHPNVASVLDSGTTADGRPYFAMELVDGQSITEFCQSKQLLLNERLELYLSVCKGIQHSHQQGVVHRDIKPGNVLVSDPDSEPVPKVIDFGLAATLTGDEAHGTLPTPLAQIAGTLPYMSPEQASSPTNGVDTRSDIFALGVLLFELLTQETPLAGEISPELPLDENLRLVRLQQPVRPSDRLRQPRNARQLLGELDAICVKAMARNPNHRYQTVAALIEAVENFLGERRVIASPLDPGYLRSSSLPS